MSDSRTAQARQKSLFTRRALILGSVQCAAFGFLARKLYRVQVQEAQHYTNLANNNRTSAKLLAPPRAVILDRHGVKLADNKASWQALIVAEQSDDPDATLDLFSSIVKLEPRERARVERELAHSKPFKPVLVRDYLTWPEMAAIEVHAPNLPGIVVEAGQQRTYPFGECFAHVVGYVAPPTDDEAANDPVLSLPDIRVGRSGLEQQYDAALRGQAGSVEWEVNAFGRVIREMGRKPGVPGADLQTSLDSTLQKKIAAMLADQSASAVVLDCQTGGVVAMVSTPSFDPGLFDSGISNAAWSALTKNPRSPLTNKAVAGVYPPGSTFKMAVAMAALECGAITAKDKIDCPGYLDVGGVRFHCWRKTGHGPQTVHAALRNSCDVFFYEAARRAGIDAVADMAERFGFGAKPQIDLPGCHSGLIPDKAWRRARGKSWNVGDTIVCGIGQGMIQATPLHLAVYVARIATGNMIQPVFGRRDALPEPLPGLDHLADSLDVARQGMWSVVNEPGATGYIAKLPVDKIEMAGKTGSAQVQHVSREEREGGHFNSADLPWDQRPHALFVCYAPFDAPRYAVSVVVEHGNAGSAIAAPLGRDIMMAALGLTATKPVDEDED